MHLFFFLAGGGGDEGYIYANTNGTKVGKIKQFAMLANPRLLGRQVLMRYASYVCVRWYRKMST